MTAFSCPTFVKQNEDYMKRVNELQHAIHENIRKLEETRQQRLLVEEETTLCTKETDRRVELLMENSKVVNALQQLGSLLQEEKLLMEQLNGRDSADRSQRSNLQKMSEQFTSKAKILTAKILEVKQHLAEAKACNMAAQSLIHAPTSKSKRKQSKLK